MPAFAKAKVMEGTTEDLTPYLRLLEPHGPGTRITLPLDADDRPRIVARSMNRAARQQGKRLRRLKGLANTVDFVVMGSEVRTMNMTPEQIRARTEKAMATRAARSR
jgi:hypothetical protein